MKKAAICIIGLIVFLVFVNIFAAGTSAYPEKVIALTFDDGPRPNVLLGNDGLIALLKKYDINGTFFLIGAEIAQNREAAEELFKNGHELENHTYSHKPLAPLYKKSGKQKVKLEIERASNEIFKIIGSKPKFIRPPFWSINSDVAKIIAEENLIVATISAVGVKVPLKYEDVNSEDYCFAAKKLAPYCSGRMRGYYPERLADYVLSLIKIREKRGFQTHILVFHELSNSKEALKVLIPELQEQGYKFVTLGEYHRIAR